MVDYVVYRLKSTLNVIYLPVTCSLQVCKNRDLQKYKIWGIKFVLRLVWFNHGRERIIPTPTSPPRRQLGGGGDDPLVNMS